MNLNSYVVAYDNKGETFDRYTILFKQTCWRGLTYRVTCSDNPKEFWQHEEYMMTEDDNLLNQGHLLGELIEPNRLPKAVKAKLWAEIADEAGSSEALKLNEIVTDKGCGGMLDDRYTVTDGYMCHSRICQGHDLVKGLHFNGVETAWRNYYQAGQYQERMCVVQADELKRIARLAKKLTRGWATATVRLQNGKATVAGIGTAGKYIPSFNLFEIKASVQGSLDIWLDANYLTVLGENGKDAVTVSEFEQLSMPYVKVDSGGYKAVVMGMNLGGQLAEAIEASE